MCMFNGPTGTGYYQSIYCDMGRGTMNGMLHRQEPGEEKA